MDLAEGRQILSAVQGSDIKHQMGLEYRFIPAIMRAKQLIEEGFLGQLFSFRAEYLHSGYIDPKRALSWGLDRKLAGGGALLDMGPHPIDLVRFLLGEYASVSAITETFIKSRPVVDGSEDMVPIEVDDIALLQVRLQNGGIGVIETYGLQPAQTMN